MKFTDCFAKGLMLINNAIEANYYNFAFSRAIKSAAGTKLWQKNGKTGSTKFRRDVFIRLTAQCALLVFPIIVFSVGTLIMKPTD